MGGRTRLLSDEIIVQHCSLSPDYSITYLASLLNILRIQLDVPRLCLINTAEPYLPYCACA
jgi:hypothetical protein